MIVVGMAFPSSAVQVQTRPATATPNVPTACRIGATQRHSGSARSPAGGSKTFASSATTKFHRHHPQSGPLASRLKNSTPPPRGRLPAHLRPAEILQRRSESRTHRHRRRDRHLHRQRTAADQEIIVQGNANIDEFTIRQVIDVKPGEAIDRFRIALSRAGDRNISTRTRIIRSRT